MTLLKKAFRAIWGNKKAYIACMVLVLVGIMMYVGLGIAADSIIAAKDNYYRQYRMADIFAKVVSIPEQDIAKLKTIEGINDALGRQFYEARVIMPDSEKIITLRLISTDTELSDPLNGIMLNEGNGFYNENDIMPNSGFVESHQLKIGDSLHLIINGRATELNICATAQGPDYVSVVRENDPIPDEEAFGIAYIQEKTLFALAAGANTYNDVVLQLTPGYSYTDVKPFVEDALSRYGLMALYPKEDQISYAALENRSSGYVSLSRSLPFVFVCMSVVILYLMLKRVIEMDRTHIGTLKGMGYTGFEVVAHYMVYGGTTGFVGGALGCVGGYYFAGAFMGMFSSMSHLPNMTQSGMVKFMAVGMLIALISGLLGSLAGAADILKLIPAEAMRPPAPKTWYPPLKKADTNSIDDIKTSSISGKIHISKLHFVSEALLNSRGNIALRGIMRNKMRSLFVVMGIMFSYGLLTLMSSYVSMIEDMLTSQFTKVELYDGKVSFVRPARYREAVSSILSLHGVTAAEGMLQLPVEYKNGHLKKDSLITGVKQDAVLYKIHDDDRNVNLIAPQNSVILNNTTANELEAKIGDILYISPLLSTEVSSPLIKGDIKVIVSDIAVQGMGQGSYMEINALANMFGLNSAVTSVVFNADNLNTVRNNLCDAKNVAAIHITSSTIKHYREMMAPISGAMYFMVVMAVVVAFAIIYNTSAISLSEQKREYSTLRVLGLYIGEVAEILQFENWMLCIGGMILGLPFARFLTLSISGMIDMDPFTFPTTTPTYAYFVGLAGCITAVYLSNQSSIKNIKKFELAEVLKDIE